MLNQRTLNLLDRRFNDDKFSYYARLRQHAPVSQGRIFILRFYLLARYEDCLALSKDPRFVRALPRSNATSWLSFAAPKAIRVLSQNMLVEDGEQHRRLRSMVQQAFTVKAMQQLECKVAELAAAQAAELPPNTTIDLLKAYALPIPTQVIADMLGVDSSDMPRVQTSINAVTSSFSGLAVMRSLLRDLPSSVRFVEDLIKRKRDKPGDDILTGLLSAQDAGDRLSEGELVSMVFLLLVAGYETTVHLISNGLFALLQHPEQMQKLRTHPELAAKAVEEMLRFAGPVHGTKMNYATEDVTIHGISIPQGSAVVPLLGSANRDPDVFQDPDVFNIEREASKHLAFSQGHHFCLGATLARLEARFAISALLSAWSHVELAVPPSELRLQRMPLWHRLRELPVRLHR